MKGARLFMTILLVLLIGALLGAGVTGSLYAQEAGGRSVEFAGTTASATSPPLSTAGVRTSAPSLPASLAPTAAAADEHNFVSRIFKRVGPSVVYISTKTRGFDFFLNPTEREGTGSGFIVDAKGYILTNAHVVVQTDRISVVLATGEEVPAEVVGSDVATDIALLKIVPPPGVTLQAVELGSVDELQVGDWVIAIGNPYGLERTVTLGVVSALGRSLKAPNGQTISNVIQTDAAINPGNSGGPLLSAQGRVVGINSGILTQSGGSEGIGIAIPVDIAKGIIDDLINFGRVQWPWLGVEVETIVPRRARWWGLAVDHGLLVKAVYKNSPAAAAGILPPLKDANGMITYFVIVGASDKDVESYTDLLDTVRGTKPGEELELKLVKVVGGKTTELTKQVKLTTIPEEAPVSGVI